MIPIGDDNPVRRTPVVTWLVIGACVVAYFVWQPSPFSDDVEDIRFTLGHAAIPCEVVENRPLTIIEAEATFAAGDQSACNIDAGASPAFDPGKSPWLAVLTSMFLHGSVIHIAGNMLYLWIFGNNVEDRLGRVGFLVFYLAGGIVATLAHVVVNTDSTVPLVGASGAIAAVMGAYLVWFPRAHVRTLVILLFFITVVTIPAMWVLGFWFVLQFFTDPNDSVAWVAHVGGFVFGILVGLLFRGLGPERPVPPRYGDPWGGDYPRVGGRY